MEAVESGPVRQCPPGLIYLETVMSRSLDPKLSCHITDRPPRAGLDFAIHAGLEHGGYVPRGRKAEDGRIDERYNLVELSTSSYPARTRRNIEASDGLGLGR
jgi:Circularly permutated YpsA SLOG family